MSLRGVASNGRGNAAGADVSGEDEGRKAVEAYFAQQPAAARAALRAVRRIVLDSAPDAADAISYQMPAFRYRGRILVYYAAWAAHYALYPASAALLSTMRDELAAFGISKGAIRFDYGAPVPEDLIRRIVEKRVAELDARPAPAGKK